MTVSLHYNTNSLGTQNTFNDGKNVSFHKARISQLDLTKTELH